MFTQLLKRSRKAIAAMTAAAVAGGIAFAGAAAPAFADTADTLPAFSQEAAPAETIGSVSWGVSQQVASRFSTFEATGGASVSQKVYSFGVTSVTEAGGLSTLDLAGKVRSTFRNGTTDYYFVQFDDLRLVQQSASSWDLRGSVDSAAVPFGGNPADAKQSTDVKIATFGLSGVAAGETVTSTSQSIVGLSSAVIGSLASHFDNTSEVKKALPLTVALDAQPEPRVVTVSGTGFVDLVNGAYVGVIARDAEASMASVVGAQWVRANGIVDGKFSQAVTIPADLVGTDLDVISWKGHTMPSAETILFRGPLTAGDTFTIALKVDGGEPENPGGGETEGQDRVVTVSGTGFVDLVNGAYVGVIARDAEASMASVVGAQWVRANGIVDGKFSQAVTIPADLVGTDLDVISWKGHTMPSAETILFRGPLTAGDTFTIALKVDGGEPENPGGGETEGQDRVVTVSGTGFVDLVNGAYVGVIARDAEASMASVVGAQWVRANGIVDGKFSQAVTIPADLVGTDLDVISWKGHTMPSAETILFRGPLTAGDTFTIALKVDGGEPENPGGGNTGGGNTGGGNDGNTGGSKPGETAPTAAPGVLQWGVKESFRTYLKNPFSGGKITLSGASQNPAGTVYSFPQSENKLVGTKGTVKFSGSVQFTGHDGAMNTKLSNIYVTVNGTSGSLYATVSALNMDDASLNVKNKVLEIAKLSFAAPKKNKDGSYTFTTTSVKLAKQGELAFSGFYDAGEVMDGLSFIAGSDNKTGQGATGSTPGYSASVSDTSVAPGDQIVVSGRGFKANQSGIRLFMYSNPVELARDLTANANGVVTAKVTLPKGTPAGTHTLSFEAPNGNKAQVKIKVGSVKEITSTSPGGSKGTSSGTAGNSETTKETTTSPAEKLPVCVAQQVAGATASWGFKSSYVAYVGRLSDGKIGTSGVSRSGNSFNWGSGTGKYNTETGMGTVRFGGSVSFAGHDNVMNSTFSGLTVQISGNTGYIYSNVKAKGLENEGLTKSGALLGTINLAGKKTVSGNTLNISGAPVTLTAEGAEAFGGFYNAGDALDPITLKLPLGAQTACDNGTGASLAKFGGKGGLASTGAEGVGANAAAMIFMLLVGSIAVIGSRRMTSKKELAAARI